ncbi:MAG: PIN domain-containing protein [Gemmatales bacterium]
MKPVFVDTAGWAALANQREQHHQQATQLFEQYWKSKTTLITTSAVLSELTALLTSRRVSKPEQVQFIEDINNDTAIQVIFVDIDLDASAWQLWRSRLDKSWTFVDCTSFVIMQKMNITDAITSDQHFEQAGFVRLLK